MTNESLITEDQKKNMD